MQRLNWRYANKGRAFIHGKTPRPSQKRIRLWRMAAGSSVYCACDAHSKPVANDSCHRNWIPCSRLLPYAGDDDETPDEGLDEGLFDSMNMLIHFPEASSQLVLTTWQNDAHTSIGGIHIYSSFWAFYHQQFRHLWQWLMISAWSFLIAQHFEGSPDEASPPGGVGCAQHNLLFGPSNGSDMYISFTHFKHWTYVQHETDTLTGQLFQIWTPLLVARKKQHHRDLQKMKSSRELIPFLLSLKP